MRRGQLGDYSQEGFLRMVQQQSSAAELAVAVCFFHGPPAASLFRQSFLGSRCREYAMGRETRENQMRGHP